MKIIFFLTVFLNFIYFNFSYSNESYVVLKINNKIITNIDIENEYRYLIALSPELKNIEEKTLIKLAKDSLIREMIKEDELIKYFDLSEKHKFMDRIITNFYKKMGMNSKNEFKEYLSKNNLKYENIE